MRPLLAGGLMALMLGSASAGTSLPCDDYRTLAESIMENRQSGVPERFQRQLAEEMGSPLAAGLVATAYEIDRVSTEAGRAYAVWLFGDSVYQACTSRAGGR